MDINLAVVKGDGIGPEIVTEAEKVLDKIGEIHLTIPIFWRVAVPLTQQAFPCPRNR